MSRFADPKATGRFVLPGGCQCDGQPHDEDFMDVRTQLGTADVLALEDADSMVDRLEILITAWNLRDGGEQAPVDRDHIERLFADEQMYAAFDKFTRDNTKVKALPNGHGAPSRNGSQGSASKSQAQSRS